jgi:hypothetical protein
MGDLDMLAKKILAGIFAGVILLKLAVALTNPGKWMGLVGVLLGHYTIIMIVYLLLIAITGYYILSSVDLIDIAVVMLFTSLLVAIALLPYPETILKLREEIITTGLGQAWFAGALWGAVSIAVLFKVFAKDRG